MVSVIPINDLRSHRKHDCWCQPAVVWIDEETGLPYPNGPLVVHNSADGRELQDRASKPWKVIGR